MRRHRGRLAQRGSTAVEFALVFMLYATILLAIIGFGHWIATLEMLADATRSSARMAVVCDMNEAAVLDEIRRRVPQLQLTNAQISVQYLPAGCGKANCQTVDVSVQGVTYAPWIPGLAALYAVPPFHTTLPRESLESINAAGEANPVCS